MVNRSREREIALVLVALLLVAAGGCQTARMTAWVVDDMVHLTDRTGPTIDLEVFDPQSKRIRLFASANETVSFQIALDADQEKIRGVSIRFSDLTLSIPFATKSSPIETIDSKNLHAFNMLPISVSSYPPWYLRLADKPLQEERFYDPLVPIDTAGGSQSLRIDPQGRLALWVDVHVPPQTSPGNYTGEVRIASDNAPPWIAKIELKVYNIVLPDSRPVAAIGGFDHRALFAAFVRKNGKPHIPVHLDRTRPAVRQGLAIMRELMQLAHKHRLELFDSQIHPILKRDMSGQIRLDWEDYDAIVLPYLRGSAYEDRMGAPAWCMPFGEGFPDPNNYGGIDSQAYAKTAREVLTACREHFSQIPEIGEKMFFWIYRGQVNSAGYSSHERLGRIVREVDDKTPILSQLPPMPPQLTGWSVPKAFTKLTKLTKLTDIIAPAGQWFDPVESQRKTRPGDSLRGGWLSPGLPPYVPSVDIIASPADIRALPWFAMKYKCPAVFIPDVLNWSDDLSSGRTDSGVGLFYPSTINGAARILPSVRLKRLRRGLQDVAYLWVLKERQRMGVALAIINAMVRYAGLDAVGDHYLDPRLDGWIRDGATWRLARKILAKEVLAVIHPTSPSNRGHLADRIAWRRFDETARTVRLEQVRSRFTQADRRTKRTQTPSSPLVMNISLELYNEFSRALDVHVKFDSLDPGFNAIHGARRISPMLPGKRYVIELTAEANHLPVSSDGKISIPVSITTDMHRPKQFTVRAGFLRAGRTVKPPIIDGKLDDWPMRAGNTAGAFTLLGRRGQQADPLAQRKTMVFVTIDRSNLYVAFRCNEPNISGIFTRPNNNVRYEQLMACGEDLVELIFDPGQTARKPEDLYHIVVKPNGVLVAERGVHSDPPLGAVRSWAAGASVAIGQQKDVWIVEMAIPLQAFGPGAKDPLWGINFARFATQGSEPSNWAGAVRHIYDPRNLGTMLIIPEDRAR